MKEKMTAMEKGTFFLNNDTVTTVSPYTRQ